LGVPTDPQICINRFTHIEKKSVPNLNHYSRSYIQKTQKENHEIKIPEDRKLKKPQSFMKK